MAKAKTKTRATVATVGDGPTAERMNRDGWEIITAPKLADEDWRTRNATARKVACRVTRMYRDGWFDEAGFQALINYQSLVETAGYDRGRSCIDFSPKGNGGGLPPTVAIARDRLAAIDFAMSMEVGTGGVALVRAVLGPYGMETIGDVSERLRPDMSRDGRKTWARDVFGMAAATLASIAR